MTKRRRKRHTPEQIVRKLRDADATVNVGKRHSSCVQKTFLWIREAATGHVAVQVTHHSFSSYPIAF